jgi:hypothetical protein
VIGIEDRVPSREAVLFAMLHPSKAVPRRYWREIALVLSAKALALVVIYLLFFGGQPIVPPIGLHLFGPGGMR